jgi:regulator of protease activity HflC (stomatin/prohibitin superfamily)
MLVQEKWRKKMKKVVQILLVTLMVPILMGCGKRITGFPGEGKLVVRTPFGGKARPIAMLEGIECTPRKLFLSEAGTVDTKIIRKTVTLKNVMVKGEVQMDEIRAHIVYIVKPGQSQHLLQTYGENYYKTKIAGPFQNEVLNQVKECDPFELKNNRAQISTKLKEKMMERFADEPFLIIDVMLGNLDHPDSVRESAEREVIAQERKTQALIERQIKAAENEIKDIAAEAVRESAALIQDVASHKYNQYEGLKALEELIDSPNTDFILAPEGVTVLVSISEQDEEPVVKD